MDRKYITKTILLAFLGVHIVALVHTILSTYNVYNIAHDCINRYVTNAINEYLFPIMTTPINWIKRNSANVISIILGWIKPVMSILFLTVGFFIPSLDVNEWCRTVNTRMSTVDKLSGATNDLTNKIMEDLCGLDLHGSKLIFNNRKQIAEEGVELTKIPTEVFIRDLSKRKQLFDYTQRATNCLSEKLPTTGQDKLIKTIAPLNTIINNNIKLLSEIIKTIEECVQLPSRPPTVGVLLSGEPGVGKSKFSEYAMKQIAKNLTIDESIYSVSKGGDYFDPYGGEHFGIHDEFLYARSDDPIIPTLTKLLSGEYYNLEGAAIHNKRQTCELKMVSFTSNGKNPTKNLLVKINENAVKAIWDRMVRVNVVDKKITTRHDTTGNLHRKPDFTHLDIELTISTEDMPIESEYIKVTPSEYIMYFTFRVAYNIIAFSKEHDIKDLYPLETMSKYIETNQPAFEMLNKKLMAAVGEANIDIDNIPSMSFKAKTNIKRNNGGRQFFVIRLEGRGGTGKSTTANHIAYKFRNIFDMPIDIVPAYFPTPSNKPCIYIVDDILTHVNSDQYLTWINQTSPKSIIIIATNIKFPVKRTWTFNSYTDLTGFSESSGIARRIGIQGNYKHNNVYSFVNSLDSIQVTMEDTMKIDGSIIDQANLINLIYKRYINFVAQTRTITIVKDTHNIEKADITINAKNFKTFTEAMASKQRLISGFMKPTPDFSIVLSSVSILHEFRNLSTPEAFVIGNIDNANEFEHNVKTLVEKLCVYKPNAKLIINIQEEMITAGYENRCLYLSKDLFDISAIIKHHGDEIYIPKDGQLHKIDLKDIALLRAQQILNNSIINLDATEIDMVSKYISKNKCLSNQSDYYTHIYQIQDSENKHIKSIKDKYPKILKCVAFITGLCSITYLGAKFIKYLLKDGNRDEPLASWYANTAPDEDNAVTRKIQQRYYNEYSKGIDHKVIKADIVKDYGEDEWNKAEWSMRNTHSAQELIEQGDWLALQKHWKKFPEDIPNMARNQITPDMITFQRSNQIEMLSNVLETNTVIIVNKHTQGKNFAVGVYGSYLISVAHAIEKDMNACFIINNGVQYPVKCIKLDRSRDIALYQLVNNTFAFKDIRQHFGTSDLFSKTKEGYFIRPIHTSRTIAACAIRYTPKRLTPLTDNGPYFCPDTGIYTVLFATTDRPMFIKSGDCGLPLVVKTDNGLKIVALHNAITLTNMAFFASVSIDDFKMIQEVKSNTSMFHFQKPGHKFNTHEWYHKILTDEKKEPKVPSHGLTVLGYHHEAHLPSFPKDSHRELLDKVTRDEIQEKLPTKPSALVFKPHLMSDSKLIKDKKGIPHTLWTQSVKYTQRELLYQKWDPYVYDTTMRLIQERITRDYGKPQFMSLSLNINGDGTTNNKPWDMTTSAGPLLKKLYNIHTKELLFENKANDNSKPYYIFANTEPAKHVRSMYELYTSGLEEGTPMSIWCKDNRKVELLPANKVHEGKVRLFNEIDLSVNMTLKKYFGHMLTKVLENHVQCPYKIGMDVYSEATIYHRTMNKINGSLISTDISGCDKSMPKEIIYEFCKAFCQGYDDKLVTALADSLTYTIHIMDGVIYLVDNGNESGSYVTTMLNCFAMEVITIYPIVEELIEKKINPTLQIIDDLMSAIYYGDDRSVKISKELNVKESDLVRCGAYFNFKVTPAKVQSDFISFCSREFIPDQDGVVFPQLKQTSVLSCLFWIKKKETKYIQANINVALFEASLHSKEFFSRVVNIVSTILKTFPEVTPYIQVFEYEVYRKVFKQFVFNDVASPVLLKTSKTEVSKDIEILQNFEQLNIKQNTYITTQNIMDYVSQINHKSQVSNTVPSYTFKSMGGQEAPTWICTLSYENQTIEGYGKTKKLAQQQAAEKFVKPNNDIPSTQQQLILNMQVYDDWLINQKFFLPYTNKVGFATIDNSRLSVSLDPSVDMEELKQDLFDNNFVIKEIMDIKIMIDNTIQHRNQITIEKLFINRNNDQSIEPATINQAAMAQQTTNLPSQTNPQPTAIAPAMTHSGDDIVGAVTTALPETLNPIGAPNMLGVGAITFDIKELIYQQFIDCDKQFIVSDDAVEGSIIAQIPYGLHSDFINGYIQYYAKAHERFNGSIQFRFTVIGNPLFSGAIGVAWYPKKIKTANMKVSELMKYSYQAEGVTNPWNKIHILHDARRQHFYRLVEDDVTDYDQRPHLVLFLMMSLQNPLKEGIQCRIRVASKLANSAEPNPFTFANPDITTIPTSLAAPIPGFDIPLGMDAISRFPHLLNIDVNLFTDGNRISPQVFEFGVSNRNLELETTLRGAYMMYNHTSNEPQIGAGILFEAKQEYLLDLNATTIGRPHLLYYTNIPFEQFKLFMTSLRNAVGGQRSAKLTSEETPNQYKGAIPDRLYTNIVSAINDISSQYEKTAFAVLSMIYYRPDTKNNSRFGCVKLVTTHGVLIIDIEVSKNREVVISEACINTAYTSKSIYGDIDVFYPIENKFASLPLGYKIFRFSNQSASAVIKNNINTPTATDDPTIAKYFKRLTHDMSSLNCLQFSLVDPVSQGTVATVRYLQEFGIFVINTVDTNMYEYLPQTFSNLSMTTPNRILRSNAFPYTDTSSWTSRTSSTFYSLKQLESVALGLENVPLVRNASMIVGGMLSGAGKAMGQRAKNKQELKLQSNQFTHNKEMQSNQFQFGFDYQERGFKGQSALSGQNFEQMTKLAQQQQQYNQQNADRTFNQQILLAGARTPVSGATTASSKA